MGLVMPKRMMDLASHAGPEDFKARVDGILKDTLNEITVLGSNVLLATWVEAEKSAGGIYKPQKSIHESRYQGTVALILKCGPTAFKYTEGRYDWEGPKPQVGDWAIFRFSDARETFVRGVSCQVIADELITFTVSDPNAVF